MISENRKKHMFQVANLMKNVAEKQGLPDKRVKELFTLGLLHDIGYEFSELGDHNYVGGEMLKEQNYLFWQEVYYHGDPDCAYQSVELDFLNWADLHTNGTGDYVSFDERIADIGRRHDMDSDACQSAKHMARLLQQKGWN